MKHIYRLLVFSFFTIFTSLSVSAQATFANPSFEGPTGTGLTPAPWALCDGTADTCPGPFSVNIAAPDGATYVGLWSGGTGALGSPPESFAQQIPCAFRSGKQYSLTLDIAWDLDGGATYTQGATIQMWGGMANCAKTQLLWQGLPTAAQVWQKQTITFTPTSNWTNVTFSALLANGKYILLDNISPIVRAGATVASVNASCGGPGNDGSATVNAPADGTPWQYSWSPGGQTTSTVTGLSPGTYTCTITDPTDSCPIPIVVTVNIQGPPLVTATATPANICLGQTSQLLASVPVLPPPTCTYTVNMFDTFGDGWSTPSSVKVYRNTVLIGTYVGTGAASSNNFVVTQGDNLQFTYTSASTYNNEQRFEVRDATSALLYNSGTNPTTGVKFNTVANCGVTPATYSYSWTPTTGLSNPAIANPVATPTATTTYTVSVTSSTNPGCPTTKTVTVTIGGATGIATTIVNAGCGMSNGSVTLGAVTGGIAPFTYNFNNLGFSGTTSYTNLAPGTYTLVVKDANGCLYNTTVTVGNNPGPTAIATTIVNSNCGTANGSVTLGAVTGGTAPYTYNFNGLGFSGTTSYTNLLAGSYPIIVKDANGCLYNTSVTVIDNPGPTAIVTTLVNSSCGNADGSVTLGAVTGGTAPYTYNFNGLGFSGTTSYTNLLAGSYPIIVKDANGCLYNTSVTVINNPGPTNIASTTVNSTCGMANGSVTLGAVTGGTAPYTYNFNGLGFSGTTNYTNLLAGSYPIIVKDANGCLYNGSITVIDNPGPTSIVTTVVDAVCGTPNGSVTLGAVTGGTPAYTYNFNNLGYSSTTSYTGLVAGSYVLLVKDANGCIYTTSVSISNSGGPTNIVYTVVNATCGTSNGSVTLGAVTGGTAPYQYDFNGLGYSGTLNYTGLPAGSYPLNVKDTNGCIYSTSITIIDAPGVTAVASTIVNATCGLSNGSVTLGTVTGGTAPYQFDFNSMGYGTATVFTGLPAGSYPINVKDANGCIFMTNVTIIDLPGPTAIAFTVVDASCGAANGSVTLGSVTGGTAPYTYNFNNLGFSGTTSYTGLIAGTYPLDVKDANGCIFTTSITIINSGGPTSIVTTVVDATCGSLNGSVTLGAVTGGTAPYTYNFNNLGFSGSTSYTGLGAGSYPLEVKDVNGCIFITTITIINSGGPTAIATTIVDATCGALNGSVTLGAVTGGTAAYTYNFNNLGFSATTSYTGLGAGSYPLEVKDVNGCIYMTTLTIINSGGPTAIATSFINPTCGSMNGSVSIGSVTGGSAPYTYNFNSTGYPGSTSYTGLAAGTYSLEVQDANGCKFLTSVTLTDIPGPTAIASTIFNENCGAGNGSVTLGSVTGGVAPYLYDFNNFGYSSTTTYSSLPAGTYTLNVKDTNGCIYTTSIIITNNPGPTAIATTVVNAACGASDGSVTLGAVTGGTAAYTYNFNNLGFSGTTSYTGLAAGSYPLQVKDANGCIFATVISVSNAGGPTALATTQTNATCGNANGSVTFGAVTGGTAPYMYQFNNMGGYVATTSYTGLTAGTYGIDVKDASGCIFSISVTIIDVPGPTAIATTVVNSTCGNTNGSVTLGAVTGGTAPYQYDFNNGGYSATTVYNGLAAGSYSIDVKDANGCLFTTGVIITTTTAPTVAISYPSSPFCISIATGQSVTITGTGTYTGGSYSATPAGLTINAATGDITPNTSTAGTYTVTYTIPATGGCPVITATTSVTINPELAPTISCGVPSTTSVQFNWTAVTGATGYDVSYVISGATTTVGPVGNILTYSVSGLTPGTVVTITVTPTNPSGGCFKAATFTCTASACTPATANINYTTSPFCSNNSTAQAVTLTGTGTYMGGSYSSTTGLSINTTTGAITASTSTPGTYTVTYVLVGTGGCPDVTDTTTVTITPLPTATIAYASSSYCTSNTFPQGVSLTGTGAYMGGSYSALPAGLTISATTGAITPSTSMPGNYTITYMIPPSGGCAAVTTTTTVTITALPTATISYATPFCISTATPQAVTITGTAAYTGGTYSAPGGLTINVNTGAIIPNTSIAGNYIVTYTIPASAGCSTTTATTSVTINTLPVVTASPMTQSICSGGTTGISISSTTPGTTFSWTVVQSAGAAGASNGTGNNITQTLTTGTTAGTAVYTITPMANGCSGASIDVTITINAAPTATATPAVSAICSGQSSGITLTSTLPGTTFTWTQSQSGVTGASNGTGNVISQTLSTTTAAIGTVIYTITPTANGCVGAPINATVTVTPPPTATTTDNNYTPRVCSNGTTNIPLSSNLPGTIFTWNVVQTNVTGASPGTGNVIAQTLSATSIGEAVYVIVPSTNGCPGAPITVRVTVYPNPTVTANPTLEVLCSGETTSISLSSNVPGTTFTWTQTQTNLNGTNNGTGNLITDTLTVVNPASNGTVTYHITPIANSCPGNSIDVTVTVKPRPEVFGTPTSTICSGESSNIVLSPSPTATTTTFTWTVQQIGVTGASAGSGSFIDQILSTTGQVQGTVIYTVTPTANGCSGNPIDITVTVNPLPKPTLQDGIICVDQATGVSFVNYTLDTGLSNAGYDFVWYFNGSTTPIAGAASATYEADQSGVYTVVVTNTATSCVSDPVSATVTDSYPGVIDVVTATAAFSYNPSITVTMNPPVNPNYLYSLDDGPTQESNVFSPVSPGIHTVHVTDVNGCTDDTKTVVVIGYPHYFTPNADGINDTWNIIGLTDAKIYIFDRYGKLIKQISPNGTGWDGTYNGERLPSTDYWFTVDYIELGQGKVFNSHFSLKR